MTDRPYVAALKAVQALSEIPTDVLTQLRLDVLGLVNDDKPGVARAAAQLRARVLIAELLQDLVESDARIRVQE